MQDLWALGQAAGTILKARGETIAVAESSSGGLISAALLAVPGASAYFLGGAVVYTGRARRKLMAIEAEAVEGMRSASEPYALLLARTAQSRFRVTWGLSETGAAGPTGNPYGDAAGHTCIGLAGLSERVITLETGQDDRLGNMQAFAVRALGLLIEVLGTEGSQSAV